MSPLRGSEIFWFWDPPLTRWARFLRASGAWVGGDGRVCGGVAIRRENGDYGRGNPRGHDLSCPYGQSVSRMVGLGGDLDIEEDTEGTEGRGGTQEGTDVSCPYSRLNFGGGCNRRGPSPSEELRASKLGPYKAKRVVAGRRTPLRARVFRTTTRGGLGVFVRGRFRRGCCLRRVRHFSSRSGWCWCCGCRRGDFC